MPSNCHKLPDFFDWKTKKIFICFICIKWYKFSISNSIAFTFPDVLQSTVAAVGSEVIIFVLVVVVVTALVVVLVGALVVVVFTALVVVLVGALVVVVFTALVVVLVVVGASFEVAIAVNWRFVLINSMNSCGVLNSIVIMIVDKEESINIDIF
jgi:hypothetical protein